MKIKNLINNFRNVELNEKEKEFVIKNQNYWKKEKRKKKNNGNILVSILRNNLVELEVGMRTAKVLKEIYGFDIKALSSDFNLKSSKYSKLLEAYNENKIIYLKRILLFNPFILIYSCIKALYIFFSLNDLKKFCELKFLGIQIGDLIYDSYIRFTKGIYCIKKDKFLFKLILKTVINSMIYNKIYKKYSIKALVVVDYSYLDLGPLIRMAVKYKILVILSVKNLKILNERNIDRHFYSLDLSKSELLDKYRGKNIESIVNEYLEKRFEGEIKQIDVKIAYKDKKIYLKEELIKMLNLDLNKKNIMIMPHCFSDVPHIDIGLYIDYYEWLLELIKKVKNINNVNFIIKPHPASYLYNEKGEVEDLLKKEKVTNIKIFPKDGSTASIKNIADVILTVRGTAGLEFSTFGIPCVNAGKGYYSGFGFNIEPNTIEEYEELLKNLDKIEKLTDEQIKLAKIVLYEIYIKNSVFEYIDWDEGAMYTSEFDNALERIIKYNEKTKEKESIIYRSVVENKTKIDNILNNEKRL